MIQTDNRPIYIRLADQICDRILLDEYRKLERIPSVREYAVSQQVNPATAARAFETLERQGVIFNKRGLGFFVAESAVDIIRKMRLEAMLGEESELFFSRLAVLEVSPDRLKEMYSEYLTKYNNK
ncbi:MAG: GntR family transcriptional regulator [Bacteroides sp.]|nr:GntR family transcriptional regulator [Bacteroides sp.]MBD5263008.1 GntR family transcriptional regulator [Bacteroides sp.]